MKFIKFLKCLHFIWNFWIVLFIQTHFFRCWVLLVSPIHLDIVSQSMFMKQVQRSCKPRPPSPPTHPPCKGIQDSLGFWIQRLGFRIQSTGFRILCQWNLDSGFQSSVGFRIPWAVFPIPKSRILDSTSKNFLDSGVRNSLHGAKK